MPTESFFSQASLALIASGGAEKDGKVYSIKPTDGTGDFTFSRGSNLAATRVGADGLIEKGRENLLTYSNDFSQWTSTNTTATSGQSGYDGTNDAWLLSKSAASGNLQKNLALNSVQTYSLYAKANLSNWLILEIRSGGFVYYDILNGVLGNFSNTSIIINASIEAVGNGWYRCSIIANANSVGVRVYPAEANGDASGTSGSIYIQDAQVELGLAATEVIVSGATTGKAGLLEDTPRFDYSGGATCPSLLLEPSRVNLLPQTEYYDGWPQTGTTLTTNTNETLSPEGLYNASKLVGNGTSGVIKSGIAKTGSVAASVYLKSASGSVNVTFKDPYGGLSNQVKSVTTEWQRFDFIGDNGASFTGFWVDDIPASGIYMWAAQIEQGSYATSYIPNHSGGTITRAGDLCFGAGDASTFNDSEGVLYAEISTNTDDTDKTLSINNSISGGSNSRLWIGYSTTGKRVYALGYVNNSIQFVLSKLMTDESVFVKIACKYALNDVSFFVNGEKVGTDTSALEFIGLNSLDFNIGTGSGGSAFLYGKAKQVLYFPTALSDSDLETLTT